MKKILITSILGIMVLTGCTTQNDLREQSDKKIKKAQECVDDGGIPFINREESFTARLISFVCIIPDKK